MTDPGPSQCLVRSFSNDISEERPGDALSRGLAAKVAHDEEHENRLAALRDQWNLFLVEGREMAIQSVPDDEVVLLSQSRKLYAAWAKFRQQLPGDQRQELDGEIPSLQYLYRSVETASESWQVERESKTSGRLKQVFARLCNNFKDHSTLLSVIPKEEKYICLLTGSLSAIAQASTNHQEIANAVADSLDELSQDMAYWDSLIIGCTSLKTVHRYIRELYVVVFEFLTEIFTKWSKSSWKRFLTSFDERAFDKLFSEKRARMRAIEQRMLRWMNLDFQKGLNEKVNKLEAGFQKMFDYHEGSATNQRDLLLELGTSIQCLLNERIGPHTLQITEVEHPLASDSATLSTVQHKISQESELIGSSTVGTMDQSTVHTPGEVSHLEPRDTVVSRLSYCRDTIVDALPLLCTALTHEIQALLDMTTQASQLMIDAQVQRRLLDWNKDPDRNNLWIQGPYEVSNPSQNTLAAGCLVALSRQSEIPCIFYFCELAPRERGNDAQWSRKQGLMDMVKSLVLQLVFLLPDSFISTRDLALVRFERLEHNVADIDEALDLLQDLRSLVPPYLHCVVNGVQHLEDRDDEQYSRNLFRVLITLSGELRHGTKVERAAGQTADVSDLSQVTKLCFTTDGHADVLAQLMEKDCLSKVEFLEEATQRPGEEDCGLMPS